MCARYEIYDGVGEEKIAALIDVMERKYPGEYKTGEIFPGDTAPAIIARKEKITAVPGVFGFPGFQTGKLLINARGETAAEKKSFADSLRMHRVIIPATGFYEWSHDAARTKYLFTLDTLPVLYICGLYRLFEGQLRFVILTRAANSSMVETHDRMPVIVREQDVRPYLTDLGAAMEMIAEAAPILKRQKV